MYCAYVFIGSVGVSGTVGVSEVVGFSELEFALELEFAEVLALSDADASESVESKTLSEAVAEFDSSDVSQADKAAIGVKMASATKNAATVFLFNAFIKIPLFDVLTRSVRKNQTRRDHYNENYTKGQ